ncbi:MAG: ATP-binding protein [Vicinamibacterales bacterium]
MKLGLGFLFLYGLAAATLDPHGLARSLFGNAAIVCAALLVVVSVLERRRQWSGCQRLFWDTFAAGISIWLLGHLGWAYAQLNGHENGWLDWHTVFSLSGGAAPLLALVARPHRGIRQHATAAVGVDIASYGLLTGFVYAYFVLIPGANRVGVVNDALLVSVQVFRFTLMAATCVVAVVARDTEWGPTYRRLAIGTTAGALLRIVTNGAIADGTYHVGSFYDAAWIVPFLTYVWAVRAAPASPEVDSADDRTSAVTFALLSAMPVLLIPILGYAAPPLRSTDPEGAAFRALLTGMATVGGLGLLTLRLVVQRGQLQRADSLARLLGAATEQTGDLILIARADGSVEHANDAFQRAVGFTRRELSLCRFPQPLDPEFAALADQIPAALQTQGVWRGTLKRRRRDGSSFTVSSTIVALKNPRGAITHHVSVERDVTDELRLRDQLVHSERLSAVGELVAGVAHEINNPLQAIVGCVELLIDDHNDPAMMRRDLEIVRREAGRAGHIVRNLLSFVRRSPPDRTPADLNQIVRQTTELRAYHLRQQNITLRVQCTSEPLPVLVDREEIQQIVLNLLMNAEQALDAPSRAGHIVVRTMHAAGAQVVEVLDDGPGISQELRGRIFEPFFTTKEVGEGTGLGLSISHGIAAAHGGSLEAGDSSVGACFRLTLPAHRLPQSVVPRTASTSDAPTRVLVVDDEEPIRRLLGRLLAKRGYEVAEAKSIAEALSLVQTFQPGLVIADVKMPGGGGVALARQLHEANPDLSRGFIFITGDLASLQGVPEELGQIVVLAKPFTASDLDVLLTQLAPVHAR